jgi:hypothetical protein
MIRNSGVETDLSQIPALLHTDYFAQGCNIIIRVGMTKGFPGVVVKVLSIYESHSSFIKGFTVHSPSTKK